MFKLCRDAGQILLLCIALIMTSQCGGKQNKETSSGFKEQSHKTKRTRSSKSSRADQQVFAALPKATTMAELPLLMEADGPVHIPCFVIIDGLQPADAGFEFRNLITENERNVNEAIRAWFVDDLAPSGLTDDIASHWEIKVEDPVVLQVPMQDVRFIEDQQCVEQSSGWLQEDVIAVTTLIGARKFSFKTTVPVDNYLQEEMIRAVGMQNMVIESPTLFVYEPALDGMGNPVINPEGEQLFKSPSGTFITEQEIPPLEQRLMKEWTLSSELPLYFAYRELPKDGWRREFRKDNCDVYLVWGDVTPRSPECDEFSESGFSAKDLGNGETEVTITTDGNSTSTTLSYGDVRMIPVNDRIILWLNPKKIEEGALLRVNSLVLDPKASAGLTRSNSESYTRKREPKRESRRESKRESKPEEAIDEEKPATPKREKTKKRDNMSDEESIDSFLGE